MDRYPKLMTIDAFTESLSAVCAHVVHTFQRMPEASFPPILVTLAFENRSGKTAVTHTNGQSPHHFQWILQWIGFLLERECFS